MNPKRSFLLYLLMLIFLGAAMTAILGVIGVLRSWDWYLPYSASLYPVYAIFRGIFLFLAWLAAAAVQWKGYRWGYYYCSIVTVINIMWFWIDRVVLTQNPLPLNRHIISMIVSGLLLTLILISLHLVAPLPNQSNPSDRNLKGEK